MKNKKFCTALLFAALVNISGQSLAVDIANVPLSLTSSVKPNIMLMVDNSGSMSELMPDGRTRLVTAKEVSTDFISSLSEDVRIGLTVFHYAPFGVDKQGWLINRYQDGGYLLSKIENADAVKRASVNTQINSLAATTNTPLAETLSDIGYYFTLGSTANLTLHPGEAGETVASPASLFQIGGRNNTTFNGTGGAIEAPVQYSCQQNFAILITDGEPTLDDDITLGLQGYSGDFDGMHLNDVAQALYEMDLRPDLVDAGGKINNLTTYAIGFAESSLIGSPLLTSTAERGGGEYYYADNAEELRVSLDAAISGLFDAIGTASAIASNSTRLDTNSAIYQSKFDSSDWSGSLVKLGIGSDGAIGSELWDAADQIPAANDRNIFTFSGGTGVEFSYPLLNPTQQAALNNSTNLVEYLRGDTSNEEANGGGFRTRSSLLGDIINSDPVYVGTEDFGYKVMPGGSGNKYAAFMASKKNRTKMIYVGANDGMLHGFNADTGVEEFAYIPNEVITNGGVADFADPGYSHRYLVDGSVTSGDAYFNTGTGSKTWSTYIAGSTGAGGRAVFALNVNDPGNFSADDVMWEFTHNKLGYSLGKPVIAQMESGEYAVIFGNGYNSNGHKAQLFIVELKSGNLLKVINTGAGSASDHNGLAEPALLDTDGNHKIDTVYAGDLVGNLWKFDLSSSSTADWDVAFKSGGVSEPLILAMNGSGEVQPITSGVEIGEAPSGESGYMIYFGTGSFFKNGDKSDLTIQSSYGIWDNGSRITTTDRSELLQQEILTEFSNGSKNGRVVSDYTLDTASHRGWYMDLVVSGGSASGERIVAAPLLRHGRAIFSTIVPSAGVCASNGESWLMEIDAETGGRLGYTALDMNSDHEFDSEDYVTVTIGGSDITVPVSGLQYGSGLIKTPTVISAGEIEFKVAADSQGGVDVIAEKGVVRPPRTSWRELYSW